MEKVAFMHLMKQKIKLMLTLFLMSACGTYQIKPTQTVANEFSSFGDHYQINTKGGLAWNLEFSFGEFSTNTINLLNKTDFNFVVRNSSGDSISVICKEKTENADVLSNEYQKQVTGFAEIPIVQLEDLIEINTERQINTVYKPTVNYAFYIELKTKSGKNTVRYIHSEPSELRIDSRKLSLIPYFIFRPVEKSNFIGVLFENEDNTHLLGGVEINSNRVWIDPKLNKDEQLLLAAFSIALINIPRH